MVLVLSAGGVAILAGFAFALDNGEPDVRGAVLSLAPYGALADYGTPDGISKCAHAVGVQVTEPGSGPVGPTWSEAVQKANAAAQELTENPMTTGLVGARGPAAGVIVQYGAGPAQLPVPAGEVVLLRSGKLSIEELPQELSTGRSIETPMQADWFPGPLIGGSAGLSLGLSAVDAFTPGPLCRDLGPIAATGFLNADGAVRPVDSVAQKAVLAERAGMQAFLVPSGQGEQAQELIGDDASMRIIEVGSLREAVERVSANYSE